MGTKKWRGDSEPIAEGRPFSADVISAAISSETFLACPRCRKSVNVVRLESRDCGIRFACTACRNEFIVDGEGHTHERMTQLPERGLCPVSGRRLMRVRLEEAGAIPALPPDARYVEMRLFGDGLIYMMVESSHFDEVPIAAPIPEFDQVAQVALAARRTGRFDSVLAIAKRHDCALRRKAWRPGTFLFQDSVGGLAVDDRPDGLAIFLASDMLECDWEIFQHATLTGQPRTAFLQIKEKIRLRGKSLASDQEELCGCPRCGADNAEKRDDGIFCIRCQATFPNRAATEVADMAPVVCPCCGKVIEPSIPLLYKCIGCNRQFRRQSGRPLLRGDEIPYPTVGSETVDWIGTLEDERRAATMLFDDFPGLEGAAFSQLAKDLTTDPPQHTCSILWGTGKDECPACALERSSQ